MSQTGTTAVTAKAHKRLSKAQAALLMDTFGLAPESMTPIERRSAVSGYDLRHRIEAMVAGISKKPIRHVYKGDGAATAPGLMILPRIVATSLFPMRHVRILLGYTAHEISHQLKTDFKLLDELIANPSYEKRKKQQIKEFWNAIEDYRIEKLVKREYPGFHVYIDDTRDFSAKRFCERVDAGLVPPMGLANPYRIGSVALTWIGAELNAYRTRAPREALNRLEPNLLAWLESWGPDMAKVDTCQEALDLAVVIVEELDRLRQNDQDDDDGEEGGAPNPNQSGKTKDSGSGKGSKNQKKSDDKKDDANAEKNGKSPDENDGETKPGDPAEDEEQGAGDASPDESDASQDGDAGDDGAGSGEEGRDQGKDGDDASDGSGGGENGEDGSDPTDGGSSGADGEEDGQDSPGDGGDDSEDRSDQGGNGKPRPQLKVEDGSEQSEAEAADLEIEELAKVINSMKGPEAKDPAVTDEKDIAGQMATTDAARLQNISRGQVAYGQIRREVGAPAARAAGILRRLLQSTARRTWQGGMEEGELDFGRIVGMTRGDQDIYRQRQVRTSVNTAVSLLLDNSGSMGGHPIRMCQETAVVLDMAIQGSKTNIEITGFTGAAEHPVLYRYRAFGQKGQAASASLGNMDTVQLGGTPVSTPLLEAWRRLSQQKEPRRILIVVSDGGADYNDVQAARQAHDFIVSQGCAILGIAIGHDQAMSNWCDNVQAVRSIEDLPIALTNLVKEALK